MKAEVKAEAEALGSEPAELSEEEQAAKEKKDVDNLTDMAEAEKNKNKAILA